MNIEANNVTVSIELIDDKAKYIIRHAGDHDRRPKNAFGSDMCEFKTYVQGIIDYCRAKYNDEVGNFLESYLKKKIEAMKEAIEVMDKAYVLSKAKETLTHAFTNSPGTADALFEKADFDEIITLANAFTEYRLSHGFVNSNIFYEELSRICKKYNITHSI